MGTTIDQLPLAERAAEAAKTVERHWQERQTEADRQNRERTHKEMILEAKRQLAPLLEEDEHEFMSEREGPTIWFTHAEILLLYAPGRYDSEYGRGPDVFYLADQCSHCGAIVRGSVEVGGRHLGETEVLASLGQALAVGVPDCVCRMEEDEAPQMRERTPTSEERMRAWRERAELHADAHSRESGEYPGELSALIALGYALDRVFDAIYWHGGER